MPTKIASIAAAILAVAVAVFAFQLSAEKKKTEADLDAKIAQLSSTKRELDDTNAKLTEANTSKDKALAAQVRAEEELDQTKKQLAEANSKATSLEGDLRLANNEINDLKNRLSAISPSGGNTSDIAAELQKIRDENMTLQAEKNRLQDQVTVAQRARADLEKRIEQLTRGINPPGLEGRIIAVDGQWNFITFNLGLKDDIAQNSQVTVVRGGQPIAQVRVTTVENRRSFGDVIRLFGQDLPGVGDQVITN